jgi:hypothetical protein
MLMTCLGQCVIKQNFQHLCLLLEGFELIPHKSTSECLLASLMNLQQQCDHVLTIIRMLALYTP